MKFPKLLTAGVVLSVLLAALMWDLGVISSYKQLLSMVFSIELWTDIAFVVVLYFCIVLAILGIEKLGQKFGSK